MLLEHLVSAHEGPRQEGQMHMLRWQAYCVASVLQIRLNRKCTGSKSTGL